MKTAAQCFIACLIAYVMFLIGFGTVALFSSDLSAVSTGAATAYSALVGVPSAGLYGMYKWAKQMESGQ